MAFFYLRRSLLTFWNCKSEVKEIAYKCLVRTQLEYACAVWDSHFKNDIHNIKMVQRRAARFVCRDYRREAGVVSSLLEKLGWQTLQERREAARLTLFCKIVNKHVAVDAGNLLRASARNTRNNSALSPAFINIRTTQDCYRYSFFSRTIADWNQPSPRTREVTSVDTFTVLLCVPSAHRLD